MDQLDGEILFDQIFGQSFDEFQQDRRQARTAALNLQALDRFSRASDVDELLKTAEVNGTTLAQECARLAKAQTPKTPVRPQTRVASRHRAPIDRMIAKARTATGYHADEWDLLADDMEDFVTRYAR